MEIAMIVIGALMAAMSIASPFIQNKMNKDATEDMREYNSPSNQMSRLAEAGLNPNLAAGNSFQTITNVPQMSNPAESLISGLGGLQDSYQKAQSMDIQKQNLQLRKSKNQLDFLKVDIQRRLAEKALEEGDLDIALKALTYDTQVQTQPAVIDKAFADAGIAGFKRDMAAVDAASYEDYRDYIVQNELKRGEKLDAETDYLLNVKPNLEWYKAKTQRMNAEEIARYHSAMEKLYDAKRKDLNAYQLRQYNLAVKYYNLAVKKQDWDKAHYWIDVAVGALGGTAKTLGRVYGIPVPR